MPGTVCSPDLACSLGASGTADRKSTRLNSSHSQISYAVFCLKKKNKTLIQRQYTLFRRASGYRPAPLQRIHITNTFVVGLHHPLRTARTFLLKGISRSLSPHS